MQREESPRTPLLSNESIKPDDEEFMVNIREFVCPVTWEIMTIFC